ncbi:MAG TPA: cation:proton antiporter [Planctomycetota bacterium]|nr:cation:proton antiporter [Planctomycetota bacterium]
MPAGLPILTDLAIVLSVAAVTTVVCHLLKQPVVLGYLVAGVIVGPHTPPAAFVTDADSIRSMADLGVVMLMFSLGLELTIRKLVNVGPAALLVTVIEVGLMIWAGYAAGLAFGWTPLESLFLGALLSMSSTTIILKAFHEERRSGRSAHLVFGVLILEDLVAVLLLAVLTAVATGAAAAGGSILSSGLRLGGLLTAMLVVGLLVVPRTIQWLVRLDRPETLLVACVGLCFGMALVGELLGYSPALGAFVSGVLVAESGFGKRIEHLVQPVRDVFAAIFFVGVGMMLDPSILLEQAGPIAAVLALVVVVKIAGGALGSFFAGETPRTSIEVGMSLGQIGEFSFLIAQLGVSLAVVRPTLLPMTIAVSVVTTFLTPYLIRSSTGVASQVDRRLPKPLQTFVTLYGSWLEELRARRRTTAGSRSRRLVLLLCVDSGVLAAIAIGVSVRYAELADWASRELSIPTAAVAAATAFATTLLAAPFLFGAFRCARAIAFDLAAAAVPQSRTAVDLGRAPRAALVSALQLAILGVTGIVLLSVTQPFLPPFQGAIVVVPLVGAFALAFWRSIRDVHGHVRAGAELVVQALAKRTASQTVEGTLDEIETTLPGFGALAHVEISPSSIAAGRTLSEIGLRGRTGATVIGILRGAEGIVSPSAHDPLRAGDVIILNGTRGALRAARRALLEPRFATPSRT